MKDDNKFKIRNKIFIESDLFYSQAFTCLSKSGIITLLRCLQKRKWEKVKIRGKKQTRYTDDGFIFPYSEAAFLNIGTTQFWANIKKLIEIGFIDLVHQGGWYQKHEREKDYSVYQLSERWRHYGKPEFITIEKPKALPDNFHIKENIKRQKLKVTSLKRSGHLHKCEDDKAKQGNGRLHKTEVEGHTIKSPQSLVATI
jgi:hypothetical protein